MGGVGQVELLQQLGHSSSPSLAAEVAKVGHQLQVLGAGEQVVHRGELTGDADDGSNSVRVGDHVVTGDAHRPGVGQDQGGQDTDHRGLAGPVGAEKRQDRSLLHCQAHLVEHHVITERLAHVSSDDPRCQQTRSSWPSPSLRCGRLVGKLAGGTQRLPLCEPLLL